MGFVVRKIAEDDLSLFRAFGEDKKARIRINDYFVIDDSVKSFIISFASKIFIPGNVSLDEKLPLPIPYFLICHDNSFIGVESNIEKIDTPKYSNEVLRLLRLPSPNIYIPVDYNIPENEAIMISEKMIMADHAARMERAKRVDPKLPNLKIDGIDIENPQIIHDEKLNDM